MTTIPTKQARTPIELLHDALLVMDTETDDFSTIVQTVFVRAIPQHQYDALQALSQQYWEGGAEMHQEGASVHGTPGDPTGEKAYNKEMGQLSDVQTACELLQEALVAVYDKGDHAILEGVAPF